MEQNVYLYDSSRQNLLKSLLLLVSSRVQYWLQLLLAQSMLLQIIVALVYEIALPLNRWVTLPNLK